MVAQVVKRWGNSLAIRIPASVANEARLTENGEVEIEVCDGVVMVRARRAVPLFSRDKLIEQFRSGELVPHDEIDFGEPAGTEFGGPDDPAR
ncbi:AbrB/MazE/SpoVT family DNA-binding domain-containing protein [Burkholderia gladioli]|uniref:AbrB/MazE/SpoVT family DNA-binding domain-containing protein n=1 Tax=Burkholderia gladioli TaxID=28095 RepID=UPI001641EB83|nr:AbrB/MazE/SpoVT family DNA-binding domain-containing protein [Burkholderia gladioli]